MTTVRAIARATARLAAGLGAPRAERRHPLDPRNIARATLLTARSAAQAVEELRRGPGARVAYAELDDKVQAFQLFESGARSDPATAAAGLEGVLERARADYGPDDAVWVCEGVGHALHVRSRDGSRCGLDGSLPERLEGIWNVVHTGLGMGLAEVGLEGLRAGAPRAELAAGHVSLCQRLARPGLAPLLFEPLGLVARLLRPDLVRPLADALPAEPWAELLWHGVGRGLYFLPSLALPARSAPWAGVRTCEQEAPAGRASANVRSGFAWAVTLVNLRCPEVVESFVRHHVDDPGGPLAQGIASALAFWHRSSGGSRVVRRFVAHVASPPARSLWREVVAAPFEREVAGGAGDRVPVGELLRHRVAPEGSPPATASRGAASASAPGGRPWRPPRPSRPARGSGRSRSR